MQTLTEILCMLASCGPMSLGNMSERLGIKETFLKKHIRQLHDSSLVVKENFGKNKTFFTITERGLVVFKLLTDTFNTQKLQNNPLAIPV